MFLYCKCCGLIKNMKSAKTSCPACEIPLDIVPEKYLTDSGLMFASQSARESFEQLIKASEDYNEEANMQRDNIIANKDLIRKKEISDKVEIYKNTRPEKTCPVCNSTALTKISNFGKFVKVGAFGILGAGDIGKTWKCNTCGTKF